MTNPSHAVPSTVSFACPQSTPSTPSPQSKPVRLFKAAQILAQNLADQITLNAPTLRAAMIDAFGVDETTGVWQWRDAYDACEVAGHLLLRRYWPLMLTRDARDHHGTAYMYARLHRIYAALPSQTRRSEQQNALQQFSTPLPVAYLAAQAAQITAHDLVLEPSAGNGGLANFAVLAGAALQLNEIADDRHGMLAQLFATAPLTQHNAANLHGYLADAPKADIVLMNPPFSAEVNAPVTSSGGRTHRRVSFAHIKAAWARLTCGGRLVAITGAHIETEEVAGYLNSVQVVLSARLPERAFGRQRSHPPACAGSV